MSNNPNTQLSVRQPDNTAVSAPERSLDELTSILEKVVVQGNLANLTSAERLDYFHRLCESLELNPLTRPFEYVTFQGKLTLYIKKDATEQIRRRYKVSIVDLVNEQRGPVYIVKAHAVTPDGRRDVATGAVNVGGLTGEALANAYMKAETKAKRRATLSICGLGILDESEVPESAIPAIDDLPYDATPRRLVSSHPTTLKGEPVNEATGEIIEGELVPENLGGKFLFIVGGKAKKLNLTTEQENNLVLAALGRDNLNKIYELGRDILSPALDAIKQLKTVEDVDAFILEHQRKAVAEFKTAAVEILTDPGAELGFTEDEPSEEQRIKEGALHQLRQQIYDINGVSTQLANEFWNAMTDGRDLLSLSLDEINVLGERIDPINTLAKVKQRIQGYYTAKEAKKEQLNNSELFSE